MMKYRTILLVGPPGAGKGTQGKALGALPNFLHCASGDLFRNLSQDTALGRIFAEYSSRGELVPDETTIELWRQSMTTATQSGRFDPRRGTLVLDGIPRNPHQAGMLANELNVVGVFHLRSVHPERLIRRLHRRASKEHRQDDASLQVIRRRLAKYEEETKPLLRCYPRHRVHRVDAEQTPAEVLFDILRRLVKI